MVEEEREAVRIEKVPSAVGEGNVPGSESDSNGVGLLEGDQGWKDGFGGSSGDWVGGGG